MSAYANAGDIIKASEIFDSIPDRKKYVVTIGAVMKIFIDNNLIQRAFDLYHKHQPVRNHVMHILAINDCIKETNLRVSTIHQVN